MADDEQAATSAAKPQPNFAARRMLASTVVITLVVLGGVWVYRLLTDTGGDASTASADGGWNRIALVNLNSGAADLVDADGEIAEEFDGAGVVQSTYAAGGTIVTVSSNELRLIETPTDAGPTTSEPTGPFTVEVPDGADIRQLPIPGRLVLVIAEPNGGNLIIVDATNQRAIDIAAELGNDNVRVFADALQYDRAAVRFAVADASTFRTAVVSLEGTEPEFHSGIPVAVGPDSLATQVVGSRADVTVADEAGERLAGATTDVIADGLFVDQALIAVTDTADVIRLKPGEEAELLPPLDAAEDASATDLTLADDDSRLIITGDTFVAVTDLDGEAIYSASRAVDGATATPEPQWRCLPVDADTGDRTIVSLATGTELHDLGDQEIVEVSQDACAMVVDHDGELELVVADPADAELTEEYSIGVAEEAWLAPDGHSVVRRSDDKVELLRVDDGELNVVADLSDVVPNRVSIEFLDR